MSEIRRGPLSARPTLSSGERCWQYTEDNDGRVPQDFLWFLRGSYLRDNDPNKPPVLNEFQTQGIACCPMAVRANRTSTNGSGKFWDNNGIAWDYSFSDGSTFEAWEITSPLPAFRGSYGFNKGMYALAPNKFRHVKLDISSVRGKANIPVLLDCPRWQASHDLFPGPPPYEDAFVFQPFCINRHNGHVNGLFLDFSARRIGLKELWTLKWDCEFDTANEWARAGSVLPEDWPEWMRNFKDN